MASSTGLRYDSGFEKSTNADIDVRTLAFKPKRLVVRNNTNNVMMEWNDSLPEGPFWKTAADGTRTVAGSGAPVLLEGDSQNPPGFRIPATVADINDAVGEDLWWEAWGQ